MTAALLSAEAPQLSGAALSLGELEVQGPRLVLVGAWGALFELFANQRRLTGGRLRLLGAPAEGAAARGDVGLVLRDAPLPPTWTLREVVASSAALGGRSRRRAMDRARDVLAQLGLEALGDVKLARLRPGECRAAGIAAALADDPAALALEEPFFGLGPSAEEWLEPVIERALAGRASLISVPELPGSPSQDRLAASSSELLILSEQRLVARGSYRELLTRARSYRVIVRRSVDALLSRLAEAGYEVRRMLAADVTTLLVTDRLGAGTLPLLRAALAAEAPILELVAVGLGGADVGGSAPGA